MFDPDIHIPDIARGAAIPPAMQLEFKKTGAGKAPLPHCAGAVVAGFRRLDSQPYRRNHRVNAITDTMSDTLAIVSESHHGALGRAGS